MKCRGLIYQLLTPLALFACLLCSTATRWKTAQAQMISARAGLVTREDGEVFYSPGGGSEVRQLQKGVKLGDSDTVLVAGKGRAEWTLNPDSYLQVGADSFVRVRETSLDRMHFDVERGEVFVIVSRLEHDASLVIHAPPALLTVVKPGRYRFRVAENGQTEAAVDKGELQYVDNQGKQVKVKNRMQINFYNVEKLIIHGT